MICPHCNKEIPANEYAKHFAAMGGSVGGRVKNEKRAAASRRNGRLGGRPPKQKKETAEKEKRLKQNLAT